MASKPNKRKVQGSKAKGPRVTPPGGRAAPVKSAPHRSASKVRGDTHQGGTKRSLASETRARASESAKQNDDSYSARYTPPVRDPSQMPSPLWVPVLMFTLLGVGMLVIVLNYIGVFGTANNWLLILGLGLILAGIMVATQYR